MAEYRALAFSSLMLVAGCQPVAGPAPNPATTSNCEVSFDAPACIVRQVSDGYPALIVGQDLATAMIVAGNVGEIADKRLAFWPSYEFEQLATKVLVKPTQPTKLHDTPWDRSQLIAVAAGLAAAAQRSADPLNDPEWRRMAANLVDDPNVVHAAAIFWDSTLFYDWNWSALRPPGLAAILERAIATPPSSNDVLIELARSAVRLRQFKPAIRQMLVERLGAAGNATPDQMAQAANILASRLDDPDAADAMLKAGGLRSENYDVESIGAKIAASRLRVDGYDAGAARILVREELNWASDNFPSGREALERAQARQELTELAEGHLRKARSQQNDALSVVEEFALASECYRRAGKMDAAIAAAREGMPKIAMALFDKPGDPDFATRRIEAGKDNGSRTAPAIALYAAGAEQEAWESGYLSGMERFRLWRGSKADFDPQWILDDTDKWLSAFVDFDAADDPAFAKRLYDVLIAQGIYKDNEVLGSLAAAAGDEVAMREHFEKAYRKALPKPGETMMRDHNGWALLQLAGKWKRAEMVLASTRVR